ncbi:MAG: hypothetical protein OEZ41_11185 [Nitrospirota bacterium]|nr:hypothetical protein [Nitrospirota bacterium]
MHKNKAKPKKPVEPIIEYLAQQNADVIAVYEVVGSTVYDTLVDVMPDYQFHITEGPQTQEILIGVKRNFSSFFTQRLEFKSGVSVLRPGALLTIRVDGNAYPLLFLHLKSLTEPRGFGLRDDQTERALKLRKVLDRASGGGGQANYVFLGDLNTMGMNLTFSTKDVSADEEVQRLQKRVKSRKMQVLDKSYSETYWPGSRSSYAPGNLDHVVAADHLQFKAFGSAHIDIRGWPQETTPEKRDAWTRKYSDHALLYFEVQKV